MQNIKKLIRLEYYKLIENREIDNINKIKEIVNLYKEYIPEYQNVSYEGYDDGPNYAYYIDEDGQEYPYDDDGQTASYQYYNNYDFLELLCYKLFVLYNKDMSIDEMRNTCTQDDAMDYAKLEHRKIYYTSNYIEKVKDILNFYKKFIPEYENVSFDGYINIDENDDYFINLEKKKNNEIYLRPIIKRLFDYDIN